MKKKKTENEKLVPWEQEWVAHTQRTERKKAEPCAGGWAIGSHAFVCAAQLRRMKALGGNHV